MTFDTATKLLLAEVVRATRRHPRWPDDWTHASAIVAEESIQLVRAAIRCTYEHGTADEMRTEAIHMAATAIRFVAMMQEKERDR